jgi:hypothetical protein
MLVATRKTRMSPALFWFIAAGALGCAFWGVVLAFILKGTRKLDRLPYWPVIGGLVIGGIAGVLKYSSY